MESIIALQNIKIGFYYYVLIITDQGIRQMPNQVCGLKLFVEEFMLNLRKNEFSNSLCNHLQ